MAFVYWILAQVYSVCKFDATLNLVLLKLIVLATGKRYKYKVNDTF